MAPLTITLGWWLIPAAVTVALILFAMWPAPAPRGWASLGDSIHGAIMLLIGVIFTLISWLIWSLLK